MCHCRGLALRELGDYDKAKDCFREAVICDPKCIDTLDILVNQYVLSSQERRELFNRIDFKKECAAEDLDVMKDLYRVRLLGVTFCSS